MVLNIDLTVILPRGYLLQILFSFGNETSEGQQIFERITESAVGLAHYEENMKKFMKKIMMILQYSLRIMIHFKYIYHYVIYIY